MNSTKLTTQWSNVPRISLNPTGGIEPTAASVGIVCAKCGAINSPGATTCCKCGQPLAGTV